MIKIGDAKEASMATSEIRELTAHELDYVVGGWGWNWSDSQLFLAPQGFSGGLLGGILPSLG